MLFFSPELRWALIASVPTRAVCPPHPRITSRAAIFVIEHVQLSLTTPLSPVQSQFPCYTSVHILTFILFKPSHKRHELLATFFTSTAHQPHSKAHHSSAQINL